MVSRLARFVVLYYSHILTTIPVPVALLVLRVVSPTQAVSLVLLLAGFWTLVGAASMFSKEMSRFRRLYAWVGNSPGGSLRCAAAVTHRQTGKTHK